jgi:hypothetical protein
MRQGPSRQEKQQSPIRPYPQAGDFIPSSSVFFTVYLLVPQKLLPFILGKNPRVLVGESPTLTGLDARGDLLLWAEVALGHSIIVLIGCEGVEWTGQHTRSTSHTGFPIMNHPLSPFSMPETTGDTSFDARS